MSTENNNPHNMGKITSIRDWSLEQASEGRECCAACYKLSLRPSEVAFLINGEDVIHMECVKPATTDLYHKVMLDNANLKDAKDEDDRKLFSMMLEQSIFLFMHALDEDINAWNHLRSVL